MSGKLDQSLDQIMQDSKSSAPRGRGRGRDGKPRPARRSATKAKAAIAAPTGGVQKNTKATTKPNSRVPRNAPTAPATAAGDSKIIVSNLPEDVTETQIKDYFGKVVGHVKKVLLTYGPNGRSRGIATIIFPDANAAAKAARQLDGVKVDSKAMKIEVVLGAKQAPEPAAPKTLADRVSKPKNAAEKKERTTNAKVNTTVATNGTTRGKAARGRGGKSGRAGRPKKKTAEELDAEMMDYFGGDSGATNGAVQPAAAAATNGGDTGMVDEVM